MKKGLVIGLGIVGFILLLMMWGVGIYNKMVGFEEPISGQWGNVESAYQRRADLIPNLVSTVKGYADFEQETLTAVIEARSKATQVTVDPSNISPEELAAFQQAQAGVGSALGRLLAVVESYPDLKANQNFMELQTELSRTENRINVERNRFNEVVQGYNTYIRKFPAAMFAGILVLKPKAILRLMKAAKRLRKLSFNG
jgi:LemA protein